MQKTGQEPRRQDSGALILPCCLTRASPVPPPILRGHLPIGRNSRMISAGPTTADSLSRKFPLRGLWPGILTAASWLSFLHTPLICSLAFSFRGIQKVDPAPEDIREGMRLLLLLLPVLWGGEWAEGHREPPPHPRPDTHSHWGRHWSSRLTFSLCPAPLAQRLELRQNVTVQEGLCVFVPCRFSLPWVSFGKFYMFWFREGADTKRDPPVATNKPEQKLHEGTQGRFSIPGEPQARNCSLSITDVKAGDSGTYFFQVETHFSKFPYLNKMLFLNVTGTVGSLRERKGHGKAGLGWGRHDKIPGQANKMPRGPALSFSLPSPALTHQPQVRSPGALEPGRPGNLTCSVPWACERATPPTFSWTSAASSSLGPRTPFSSVLTLTPRPQDHGTRLTCQVKFPTSGAMVERSILLNVTCE